jgi:hypothetical protein
MLRYYIQEKIDKTLKPFFLIFILVVLTAGNVFGQVSSTNEDSKNKIEWIDDRTATLTIINDNIVQVGKIYKDGDKFIRNGKWTLAINEEVRTTIMYDKGDVKWIQSHPLNKTFTQEMIRIHRLEKRIASLEKQIENI